MVVGPDGSLDFFDKEGRLRVRMGDLSQESPKMEMYHMTLDGEYVTGVLMDSMVNQITQWGQVREEFGHLQAWCKTGNDSWHTVPGCDIGRGRWEGVSVDNVPECVRMAEMLR